MTDILAGLMQETISGVALGCIYALIALGFTLIYKATEVVNFSQGEIMMVGAYMHFFFLNQFVQRYVIILRNTSLCYIKIS